ncbi:MAG: hypothetical protein KC680_01645 [Candidatus Peregrinibacteria bacterium]|nr:hypothetical protein [Candidatus Peregrinibacteria bacterium]MCB9808577.1 hypothetical protein [Candidatus Peribacteria bacterium]
MSTQLNEFIAHARKKGMDHSTIRMLLLSSGWKEKEIAQALSAEGLDMPVPTPPDVGGAREAFLHLLSFAALYTLVISLIILIFQYIDRLLPDTTERIYSATADFSGIRMSMAAVIVSFPLLLWMSRIIYKDISQHPQKAWSGIRRWLTYLTLFVAASSLMVDVITLVFNLLQGELSIRFLLKVAVVFLLAGGTFGYYFLLLKSDVPAMKKLNRTFLSFSSGVVIMAFAWGIVIVGSPVTGRQQRIDEARLQDLRDIQSEIYSIVYDDRSPKDPTLTPRPIVSLPKTLQEVVDNALYQQPRIYDPETNEEYVYIVQDARHFSLCTTFSFARDDRYDIAWNHPEGRHCFEFDTTERYFY